MATYNAERVVSRYAKEFSTEKAKADYLKKHPDADKSKHTVKKEKGLDKKPTWSNPALEKYWRENRQEKGKK